MNVVDSGLKPHGSNGRHAQKFDPLFESDVAAIDSPAIELRKAVAVYGIIQKNVKSVNRSSR